MVQFPRPRAAADSEKLVAEKLLSNLRYRHGCAVLMTYSSAFGTFSARKTHGGTSQVHLPVREGPLRLTKVWKSATLHVVVTSEVIACVCVAVDPTCAANRGLRLNLACTAIRNAIW